MGRRWKDFGFADLKGRDVVWLKGATIKKGPYPRDLLMSKGLLRHGICYFGSRDVNLD